MRLRKNSRASKILKQLALGSGFLALSMINPLGGTLMVRGLIKQYFRKKAFERYRFLTDLKNLQSRSLINYKEFPGGRIEITLSKKGKERVFDYKIDELKLTRPNRWDKQWRLVMFDIPHYHKKARDAFRKKLQILGFYPIQKSVFITPFPCEEEIEFLTAIFDIRRYVLILYVSRFEDEEKFRHYFKV
jgi:DNA-binding transcriptional regulator PaaX